MLSYNQNMIDVEETKIGAYAILVTKDKKIVLQQRDNKLGIVNPGLISMFGGSIKLNEDLKVALKRELFEELEISLVDKDIEKLGIFYKTFEIDGIDHMANVFVVKNIDINLIKVHEGKGFVCDDLENLLDNKKLTRITRLALEKYQTLKTN